MKAESRRIALDVLASLIPILFLQRLGTLQRDDFFRQGADASKSACQNLCPAAPGWLVDYFLEITETALRPSGTGFAIAAGLCLVAALHGIRAAAAARGFGARPAFLALAVYALFIWNAQWNLDFLFDAAIAPCFLWAICEPRRWTSPVAAALTILWVNVSGGFILSFVIIAALLLGALRSREEMLRYVMLFVLVVLASLVNPQKSDVFEPFLHGMRAAEPLARSLVGVQGADLHVNSYIPKFIAILLLAQMFLVRRASRSWQVLAVAAVIAPLLSPLFFVLLGIVCALECAGLLSQIKPDGGAEAAAPSWSVPASICALCAFLYAAPGTPSVWNRFSEFTSKVNSANPVLNDAACANELAAAGITPFVDRRQPLIERSGIPAADAYSKIVQLKPGWEDLLERSAVRFAVLREDSRLASVLQYGKGWTVEAVSAPLDSEEARGKRTVRYILLAGDLSSR